MTDLSLSNYYKAKKTVLIYLETDPEIKILKDQVSKKAVFITEGRDYIKYVWSQKKHHYIIWTYQTNQDDRWIVVVIDTQKLTANIHTSTTVEQAKKEKAEIVGFLTTLNGLTNASNPSMDFDTQNRNPKESGYNAILYIKKLLERININKDIATINADNFNEPKENGVSKLKGVETKYKELEKKISAIPSLKNLEKELKTLREHKCSPTSSTLPITATSFTFQTKTIEQIKEEITKLLKDTQIKWNSYLTDNFVTNINVRMFQDFRMMAREILPFIDKALKSKGELVDYQLLDKEWGNHRAEYDINRDYLNAWYTLRIFLNEWEIVNKNALKTPIPIISEEQKKKLTEYDNLKTDKEKLLEENKLLKKNKKQGELEGIINQTPAPRNKLVDRIRQKITEGYNSPEHLWGSNLKIMKTFLTWEYVGTEEQKGAIKTIKLEINNCINYLEKVQSQTNY